MENRMIKMVKHIFFCAAFLLCAAFVFAADDNKAEDIPAIRVYDAKEVLVCELTEDVDIKAFNDLLLESVEVSVDDAAFVPAPTNAEIAYRYEIFKDSSNSISLLIYANSQIAYIPNTPKSDDMPDVFAWVLFGEAYNILSGPALLKKELIRYQNRYNNIFVYDAKGFLVSAASIPSALEMFGKIMDIYSGDIYENRFSGSVLPEKSVHKGRQLLYRYTVWSFNNETIRIYIYGDTDKAVLTKSFPDWAECTLSKEGYELFKNPKQLIKRLEKAVIE